MFDQHILAWLFVHMYDPGRQSVAEQQGGGGGGGTQGGAVAWWFVHIYDPGRQSVGEQQGQGRGDTSCAIWKRGGLWGGER